MPARFGRRRFIAGMAVSLAATACGGASRQRDGGSITVANFPFYVDADTNPGFTAATGIAVQYHEEIVDEDVWSANVRERLKRGEPLGRDVVIVSDWVAAQLDRQGWLSGDDRTTWAQGMVGIAYDRRATGRELTRISDLFQSDLLGRVAMPADARSTLGMALLADGVDPSVATAADIRASSERLANSRRIGQVLPFDGVRPIHKLVRGDAAAIVTRASDTVGLESAHPDIRFVVPEEGGLLLTDVGAIPSSASNPAGAASYLEYTNDPNHAVTRFRSVPAMWTVDGVTARMQRNAPDVVSDPRRNPSADVRARLKPFRILDDGEDAQLRDAFAGVVTVDR
jgi:spermidine/putrescine transport system substrate-binding protein